MKIIKDLEHGMLMNCFGFGDRCFLSATIMTFFAFDDPDRAISEQEMWPFVQEEIGTEKIFDMAMPKPKGEFLVWGRCFAPEGRPITATQVHVQVGPIKKNLYIFGNRYWKRTVLGTTITDPEPFMEMPIVYERAFGGKDFNKNPLGRGMDPMILSSGKEVRPLPNIEAPRNIIGSPGDRPRPAGFGPLDFSWPQRSRNLGTYDKKWLQERWPFYPDDLDWICFNAAPEDQQMEAFFFGNERFVVGNMHKKKPLIESRLPNLRHRLFMNRLKDKGKHEGEKVFSEIRTHIDTIWLFPNAERGVVIHRGVAEVADDEALDVTHLYVATEEPSGQEKPIEYYHEEFAKKLEKKLPEGAVAEMAEAKKKLAEAAERLKDLPQEITDSFAAGLGQAPAPVRTHGETIAAIIGCIDQQGPLLDAGEKRLLETKAKFGHITKIDTSCFQTIRQELARSKMELQKMPALIEESHADAERGRAEMSKAYKKAMGNIDPALLKEKGIDPDMDFDIAKKTPAEKWHEKGMRFIEQCKDNIQSYPEYLNLFIAEGMRHYTVKRGWLGFHPAPETDDPVLWGLPEEDKSRKNPKELDLPSGLVIPCFDKGKLRRIKIVSFREMYPPPFFSRVSFKVGRKITSDTLIEGSDTTAMVHGAEEGKPFIRVAYDLEALLLQQELGGFCAVVAMKTPEIMPDKETAELIKKAPQFLILQYPESQEPADNDIGMWKNLYPQGEPLQMPLGENLFEAKKAGVDLWKWVADALRVGIAPDPERKPKDVNISKPGALAALIPVFDIPALIKKARDRIMADMQPELDLMEKQKKEMTENVRKTLEAKGIKSEEFKKPITVTAEEKANPFAFMKKEYAQEFDKTRQSLKKRGLLTAEIEKQIGEAEKSCSGLLAKAAERYENGMARIASAEKKIAGGMPDWAKKLLSDAGIDSEEANLFARLTRQEVIDRHNKGLGLEGKNLSGLDLSGLDLRGANLKKANLKKANLGKCILDGADLAGAMADEADFTQASMVKAKLMKCFFQSATFVETNLLDGNLAGTFLNEADMSGSVLTGAILEKTVFQKVNLRKSNLSGAKATQASFLSVDASFANFTGTDLTKAIFLESNMEETNFSGAVVRSVHFIETKGKKVNFEGADMYNSRIINDSTMTESAFTNVKADKACWMKSDLSGSDFRGTVMNKALVEKCNLAGSNLAGIKACETRFTKTDLSDVTMEKANLFRGSLRKSKLVRANLNKANLYSVEFYRTGVGDTKLEGANLKMTQLYKRTDLLPEKKEKG
ncbi:MAG: DUF2169 domain-containing protein [Syntrophus sp. (in: bacteria)]